MKKLLLLTYLFAFISVFGQDKDIPFDKRLFQDQKTEFQEAIRNIKEGDFHFFDGSNADLTDALFHYLRAQEFNPYSSVLNFKIGVCYLYTNRKFKALDYLKFAYKVNPDVDENIRFYLAQAHQLNGDFERAIELYTEHKDGIRSGDQIQRLFINKKIKECKTGIELKESPVRVWIDNLGDSINSKYPEFSPVISADNRVLFYTARRPDSQGDKIDNTGYHYEDVYQSKRTFGTDWGNSTNVGGPVNTKSHDATVGLAPDGKSLIIYRGINAKNGDLYITRQQDDGSWEEPVSLGENINTKFHESSASLSFDEKTLYFVSDQPGGFGQHDIYVSNWDEEKQMWGEAENLGSTINTQFEEKGVFFHSDGRTLYFSSDGHNNMGGLDVFKTTLDPETGEWSTPENLGYPISTPDDDIYFVVTGDERYAYYSSFRQDGFGEKDIYKITFLGPKKEPLLADAKMIGSTPPLKKSPVLVNFFGAKETDIVADNSDENGSNDNKTDNDNSRPKVFILKGTISDCLTKQGIPATLSVTNERTGEKIKDLKANPDGTYTIALTPGDKYGLTASGNGYTIHSKTLTSTKKDENTEVIENFELCKVEAGSSFALRNIYFDFDKYDLRVQASNELDRLVKIMKDRPTMIIELGGHTDRRGSADYNLRLSKERAQIAKDYLVKKGISADRIRTKGYGETQLEVSDEEISAMKSRKEREAAHQLNRRTIVKVISE